MDIKVENLPKNEVRITVKIDDKRQKEIENTTAQALSEQVKVKGFREGHATAKAIKAQVGEEQFVAYMLENNIALIYSDAVTEKGIEPISRPNVEIKGDNPVEFTATFAVMPEVKIKDLDKIKVKAPKIKVDKKEIKEAIEQLTKSHTEYKTVDRKAKKGDKVEIDFEGFDEGGAAIEGAASKNHPVIVGEGMFIPGFEENLEGVKKDDEIEFTVKFPKDYHQESLQSKPITFKVKILGIEEPNAPEVDEAFIEKLTGQKKTKDEFMHEVEHELEHKKIHDEQRKQEDSLFEMFLKKSEVEVSEILIDDELQALIQDMQRDAMYRGANFEEFKKVVEAKEGKELPEIYKPKAEERVKIRFILDEVIKQRDFKVDDKDVDAEAEKRIGDAGPSVKAQAEETFNSEKGKMMLKNQMILDMVFKAFIEPIPHEH